MKYKLITTCIMLITIVACYFMAKYYQVHEFILAITILSGFGLYYFQVQKEKGQNRWKADEE